MSSGFDWLEVESLDLEAQGVAHREDGKVVFIEGALPGERVQVSVSRKKNQWEAGQVSAISRQSSQRVTPGCPHFGLHDREPETLEDLAARLGLTRERIRQIQQESLVKLKRRMARHGVDRDSLF